MFNHAVFNSVADIKQFGDMVVGGYEQVNVGLLPQPLYDELSSLTNTLVEGMGEAFSRLQIKKDSPLKQAESELFMDMQRRFCDKIPQYAEKTKDLILEDF